MKRTFRILCLLILLFSFTACQKKKLILEVTVTYWSGVDPGEAGYPFEVFVYKVEEGTIIEIPMKYFYDSLTITITSLTDSKIEFDTSEALCIKAGEGDPLNIASETFAFSTNTPFTLVSPTMDAGVVFEFVIK